MTEYPQRTEAIKDALELASESELDDLSQSSKFEGEDRLLAAALYEISLHGGGDHLVSDGNGTSATVVTPFVLFENSQGFVSVEGPFNQAELDECVAYYERELEPELLVDE